MTPVHLLSLSSDSPIFAWGRNVSDLNKSPFVAGAVLVWRRQSVLWWIFLVNFILAGMGAATFMRQISPLLDESLESQVFVRSFNPMSLSSLLMEAHGVSSAGMASACLIVVFFVFMLFVEGGLLEVYRLDRGLTKGEFFEASGRFFWRFVRLFIMLLIVLIPVGILNNLTTRSSHAMDERSPSPVPGIWVRLIGVLLVLFLMQAVRLWFDMAQVRAVAEDERAIRRALARTFKITFGNFGSLYWMYLRISVVAWLGMAVLLWIWVRLVRPEWIGISFLLTQLMLLGWLGTRLWQRASETVWYQRRMPAVVKESEQPAPEPAPVSAPEAEAPDFSI
jgi:hypothetical protein